jgi:hypothetical protein
MMHPHYVRHNQRVSDAAVGTVAEEGWRVIRAAVVEFEDRLGGRLVSAYAIGSLAHGGFAPAVSDIDLALLTRTPVPDIAQTIGQATEALARTLALGNRLSVFHSTWEALGDPASGGRFPPIDRFDLVRYGVLVHGPDLRVSHASAPTVGEIRAHAVDSALRRVTPEQLAEDLQQLKANGVTVHDATKLVLWPIRLQHVCDIGQATGNADAVAHYLAIPDAGHRTLAQDALGWRDLPAILDADDARRRIAREIYHLHAEVFQRLAQRNDVPRHHELAERTQQLSGRT